MHIKQISAEKNSTSDDVTPKILFYRKFSVYFVLLKRIVNISLFPSKEPEYLSFMRLLKTGNMYLFFNFNNTAVKRKAPKQKYRNISNPKAPKLHIYKNFCFCVIYFTITEIIADTLTVKVGDTVGRYGR